MKYYLAFALLCSSLTVFAEDSNNGGLWGPGMGFGYGVKFDPCLANINMAISGYGMLNGQSPVKIDDNGKLVIDHKKIKSLKDNGNVKTITYMTTNPYGGGETAHKIDITEEKGKITHVTRFEDVALAKKWQKEMKSMGTMGAMSFPMITKTDLSFEHKDSGCQMTNSEMTMEKDGKEEIKVTHDKILCDNIAPLMNQMGRQNAMQCAGLFSQIEASYKDRFKEMAKQGKELAMAGSYGMSSEADFGSKSRDWTMMNLITNCMMTENPIMPGMGMGMGYYPGPGTNGGIGIGVPAQVSLPADAALK